MVVSQTILLTTLSYKYLFTFEYITSKKKSGATAELVLQDGRQRNSHPRQEYFCDVKGRWYDITEMKWKERTVARQE
jgi:hypothetical protein